MKIVYNQNLTESPFNLADYTSNKSSRAVSGDHWGAFSLEKFHDVGGLSYTHEDAEGWIGYLSKFQPANFWYKDENVKPWAYYEDYDNWQDTYGLDAVMAVYHSGHGGMDGNGVFQVPLGGTWGNLGSWVFSDRMRVGNEQARYLFWSTCLSLRVKEGHNPIRTWNPANLGFRMLFGFETVSWDNPNYGKFFWEEWNKNQSLSDAWLNASWRIAHDQEPSVVACGATKEEAINRLNTERLLSWDTVSHNWWWWKWYNASRSAIAGRDANRILPEALLVADLEPPQFDEQVMRNTLDRFGLEVSIPEEVALTQDRSVMLKNDTSQIVFNRDGSFEVRLAQTNPLNKRQVPVRQAVMVAQEALQQYGFNQNEKLVFDGVRVTTEAGGTAEGSGELVDPFVTETTVQFRQVVNGAPVITNDAGIVRVTIDNDGTVTGLHNSLRQIVRLTDRPRNTNASPQEEGNGVHSQPPVTDDYEQALSNEWSKRMAAWAVRGKMPVGYTTVPGSTEVGYEIRGNEAVLTAQRAVEVDFGKGIRKRYWVSTPIFE